MEDDGPAVTNHHDAVEGTSDETANAHSFEKFLSSAIFHLARAASRARWARSWVKVWLPLDSLHRIVRQLDKRGKEILTSQFRAKCET